MPLNIDRIEHDLNVLRAIGDDKKGGITRLAYSEKDEESHEYISEVMSEFGFSPKYDAALNLHISNGRKNPRKIVFGSHLDSVPNGGNYDGVVGILTGAEIMRAIKEDEISLEHDLELVIFRGEESSRFNRAMIGSGAVTGTLTEKDLLRTDENTGMMLADAIRQSGGSPEYIDEAMWNPEQIAFYFEDHIEQGRVLQDLGKKIGIVTGIAAPVRYWIDLHGRKDHSGNTPMDMRRDPLDTFYGIGNWKRKTMEDAVLLKYSTVATIGNVIVPDGSMNSIPGQVRFCLDIRDIDIGHRDLIEKKLKDEFDALAAYDGITIKYDPQERKEPAFLPERIYKVTEEVCNDMGIGYHVMHCGAGHDGLPLSHFGIDVGMLLIPSKDGLSHQKEEYSSIEDIMLGAQVKYETMLRLDKLLD